MSTPVFKEKYHLEWAAYVGECTEDARNQFVLEVTDFIDSLVHERGLIPEGVAGCVGFAHPLGRKQAHRIYAKHGVVIEDT